MTWEEIKNRIYHWDGSWRDIYVRETDHSDWHKWVNFVNSNHKIDWYNGISQSDENKIDFNVILDFWNGNQDLCSTAKIFIDNIQVNAHFFDTTEIENDIDPREFQSMEDHNKLIHYMSQLSIILNKPVILTPENFPEITLIKVELDKIELDTQSNPCDWQCKM